MKWTRPCAERRCALIRSRPVHPLRHRRRGRCRGKGACAGRQCTARVWSRPCRVRVIFRHLSPPPPSRRDGPHQPGSSSRHGFSDHVQRSALTCGQNAPAWWHAHRACQPRGNSDRCCHGGARNLHASRRVRTAPSVRLAIASVPGRHCLPSPTAPTRESPSAPLSPTPVHPPAPPPPS
jgi:hypothetical protein